MRRAALFVAASVVGAVAYHIGRVNGSKDTARELARVMIAADEPRAIVGPPEDDPWTVCAGKDHCRFVTAGTAIWQTGDAPATIACISTNGLELRFDAPSSGKVDFPDSGGDWSCVVER